MLGLKWYRRKYDNNVVKMENNLELHKKKRKRFIYYNRKGSKIVPVDIDALS